MLLKHSTPTARLLLPLLESYEAGASFGRDADWARDVIVKIDEKVFSDAFAPNGAEILNTIFDAARDLERQGAVRIVYHRGIRRDQPKEVRLGPAELTSAYQVAKPLGFLPLADVLERISAYASALRSENLPPWMDAYLEDVAERLLEGDGSNLGAARKRLKERETDVRDALCAAAWLARGTEGMERIVSERIFGTSKRLAGLKGWIRSILEVADPQWHDAPPQSAQTLLEHYGIRSKPIFLYCAGALRYVTASGERNLMDDRPSAAVPEGLVLALGGGATTAGELTITTIENETPYHLYVEERGGPEGLASLREMVVYTAGYPNSVVLDFLCTAARSPSVRFRHWGDADADGVQIWWVLRNRLERAITFFRTTAAWAGQAVQEESRMLSAEECGKIVGLQATLAGHPDADAPDVREGRALLRVVLDAGKWVEQERYYGRSSPDAAETAAIAGADPGRHSVEVRGRSCSPLLSS